MHGRRDWARRIVASQSGGEAHKAKWSRGVLYVSTRIFVQVEPERSARRHFELDSPVNKRVLAVAHRPCPSHVPPVAQLPNSRRVSPSHPAAQVHLVVEAPRKHHGLQVTKLLFYLPTMTSPRPKERCPRNRPIVKRRHPHLQRHGSSLTRCLKYRRTKKASARSRLRENRPNRPRRRTRTFSAPSRSYKRSVLRFAPPFRLAYVISD